MTLANQARQLNLRSGAPAALPPLIMMTDPDRLSDPLSDPLAAARMLPRGSAVILRHYREPERAVLAGSLARLCRERGLRLLIAADPHLALNVGAEGVHLPERLARRARWARLKPGWMITAAAHSRAALVLAARAGADAAILAPVFATESHPGRAPLGVLRFAGLASAAPLPVYALGGMTARSARRLTGTRIAGIAAIGAFQPTQKRASM